MRQVYNVVRAVPHLGLMAGDVVVVDTADAVPICLMRSLPPNFGAVLQADMTGAIVSVDISPAVPGVRVLEAVAPPLQSSPR